MALDAPEPGVAEPPPRDYAPVRGEPADETQEESGPPTPSTEEEGEPQLSLWRQFLDEIREQSMSIYSFLNSGRFCGVENGQVIICFDTNSRYNKSHLERKEIKMLLEETLRTIAGVPLKIKLILEHERVHVPPPPKEAAELQEKGSRAEEAEKERMEKALSNPIVRKTIELFNGKIVYVSG
ncbi:MAG: hypothetical protein JSV16_07525, partial [Candidatus Hydrogenedentota bacterium]